MGGHAITCPQTVLSIYLYDATTEMGPLLFLPGSHRACVGFFDPSDPDAPEGVTVAAKAGDVTLHYSDVMHAAPAPTATEGLFRQSVLMNFAPDYEQHRGGRHYNDVLLEGSDDGQVEHLGKNASYLTTSAD
jgi:ectoine hydroxylase-related dioxygenase (phytanoyl-CoA dioxygenase family)